ncbi:MAG: hypothetical protein WDW38_005750 [Sanguina aurantia]
MDSVEVSPADLKFKFVLNKQLLATIVITNNTDSRLAYKIKTTAPKKYVVRPSSGIAEPKGPVTIQVIMQAQKEQPLDFNNCKDKFMVQTCSMLEDEQIDKDTFTKEGGKDLKESRLRVILDGPAAPPSPVPESNEFEEDARASSEAAAATAVADLAVSTPVHQPAAVSMQSRPRVAAAPAESAAVAESLKVKRERDELRKQLDAYQLSTAPKSQSVRSAAPLAAKSSMRITIIQMILVAIIAFIIGHYT